MLLKRLLLNDFVEVYQIAESLYGDIRFYMIFYDYRRPSTFKDFSYIHDLTVDNFLPRDNFIQAIIVYNQKITDEERDYTYEIASGFLEDKDNCDWALKYISANFKELMPMATNHKVLVDEINKLLKVMDSSIPDITINDNSFKNLLQR